MWRGEILQSLEASCGLLKLQVASGEKRIVPRHILLAVMVDEELHEMC